MQFLLSQCHTAFAQHQSVLITLFLAGLVGGLTHCAGMCGPFVMTQTSCKGTCDTTLKRLSGAALLPYHLGRMTTYMLLGAMACLLSKQVMGTPLQQWTSFVFLSLAGAIFIASALPQVKRWFKRYRQPNTSRFGDRIGRMAKPFLKNPKGVGGYGLGMILGLLPCGLIFAALMVVATTGSVFTAMLAMALFTIGTFPSLFAVGLGSQFAKQKWPRATQTIARGVMVFNGFSLFFLAGQAIL